MNKVILVGLDGFRPEIMAPSLTPHLCALAEAGVRFTHHRCQFPSETYVNLASLMTGCPPGRHGIVANQFLDRRIDPREPWIGNRVDMIEAGVAAYDGGLITAPTLGERLAQSGKRLWLFGGGSPGSARLKHPTVARYADHLLMVGQDWRASIPQNRVAEIVSRLGTPPTAGSAKTQRYLAEAFLHLAEEEPLPDVTVLWFGEPDHAFHTFGIGADETLATLREVDAQLGRVVAWWRSHPEHERIQLIVTSDHGHITQTQRVDTTQLLADAGFRTAPHLEDDADLALVPGYCGNIRVRDGDPGRLRAAADALMAHPDVGMVFTRPGNGVEGLVPGSFSQTLIMVDHARSADIVFTLRTEDEPDPFGYIGTCRYDNGLPAGVGYHGGLHPSEMTPLLVATGSAFGAGRESALPSAVMDILPTVLALIGEPLDGIEGRVLTESFAEPTVPAEAVAQVHRVAQGTYAQELQVTMLGDRAYLDHGRRVR